MAVRDKCVVTAVPWFKEIFNRGQELGRLCIRQATRNTTGTSLLASEQKKVKAVRDNVCLKMSSVVRGNI